MRAHTRSRDVRPHTGVGIAHAFRTLAALAVTSIATPCIAQSPSEASCTAAGILAAPDACLKVHDLFSFLAPQVGVALSGGNAVLGESGTLGGLGKFSVAVRATLTDGAIPANRVDVRVLGTNRSDFGAKRVPVPVPAADFGIGIFKGLPVGLTNVGGVDLLVGATYVPNVDEDAVHISTPGSALVLAYGARVGILQESALVPGVSLSLRMRKLPKTSILYANDNDTLDVRNAAVSSRSFRVTAGKHFGLFGIAGGLGRDNITSKSTFRIVASDNNVSVGVAYPETEQKVARNNAFLNLSVGLPKAQLVGEVGWSGKGDAQLTYNTFGTHAANEAYRYYSLGLGFRFP